MGGIALHGFDEIGDQVGTSPQLNRDSAEPLFDQGAQPNQPVVHADEGHHREYDEAKDNPAEQSHVILPPIDRPGS